MADRPPLPWSHPRRGNLQGTGYNPRRLPEARSYQPGAVESFGNMMQDALPYGSGGYANADAVAAAAPGLSAYDEMMRAWSQGDYAKAAVAAALLGFETPGAALAAGGASRALGYGSGLRQRVRADRLNDRTYQTGGGADIERFADKMRDKLASGRALSPADKRQMARNQSYQRYTADRYRDIPESGVAPPDRNTAAAMGIGAGTGAGYAYVNTDEFSVDDYNDWLAMLAASTAGAFGAGALQRGGARATRIPESGRDDLGRVDMYDIQEGQRRAAQSADELDKLMRAKPAKPLGPPRPPSGPVGAGGGPVGGGQQSPHNAGASPVSSHISQVPAGTGKGPSQIVPSQKTPRPASYSKKVRAEVRTVLGDIVEKGGSIEGVNADDIANIIESTTGKSAPDISRRLEATKQYLRGLVSEGVTITPEVIKRLPQKIGGSQLLAPTAAAIIANELIRSEQEQY